MGAWHQPLPGVGSVQIRATDRRDGDLRVDGDPTALAGRRAAVIDRPWVWLRQVHGADVVVVQPSDDPVEVSGTAADALVTSRGDVALAVHGADCGVVALWSPEGVFGAAHAGWRGLEAGVIGATVEAMRDLGATRVAAVVGPCIGPECYEFGVDDLDRLGAVFDPSVVTTTGSGSPALDLPAGLLHALRVAGVDETTTSGRCTACSVDELWSHRARRDEARQAMVVWRDLEEPAS